MEIREFIERGGTEVPPIEQQAREFLTVIWNAIPAGSVIGLSADKPYFDRKEIIWKDTTIADWAFIDDGYEFEAWASAQNHNPLFIERGYGSVVPYQVVVIAAMSG